MSDHDYDGCVRFLVATTGEILLEIDRRDGSITSKGQPCSGPRDVAVALLSWLDEVSDEPVGEIPESAGDVMFGVPAKPDALRLCSDGRLVACGQVGFGAHVYVRFVRWLCGAKFELKGNASREDVSPADSEAGVSWRFASGRGKGPDREGGNVVFTARAKAAKR